MDIFLAEKIFHRLKYMEELTHEAKRHCRQGKFASLRRVAQDIHLCENAINILIKAQDQTESGE